MSPVTPDAGGFVVISQVRQNYGQGPEEEKSRRNAVNLPKPVVSFYRGEPEVLGTTQIFVGILLISIGITITISHMYSTFVVLTGVNFWSGILYIIAGSLSVSASEKPTMGKVKTSLGINIFNCLASFCGILFTAIETAHYPFFRLHKPYCAHYKSDIQCLGAFFPSTVYVSILAFILMLFVLMFCIAISTIVFACRTVCRSSFDEMHVVIYQNTSMMVPDTTRDVPCDSTEALTSELKTQT